MCEDLGLEIKSLKPYGGAPEIVMDVMGKCIASAKLPQSVPNLFGIVLCNVEATIIPDAVGKDSYSLPPGIHAGSAEE